MTALIEPRRVSHMIYGMLLQQQSTLNGIGKSELSTRNIVNMAVINHNEPQPFSPVPEAQCFGIKSSTRQVTTKPKRLSPWIFRFGAYGLSARIAALQKGEGTSYQAGIHLVLLGRMFSVQLQMSCLGLSFDHMLHTRNVVPTDSPLAAACRNGDFNSARKLLESGTAQGSDITDAGWPMLDVSIAFFHTETAVLMQ